MRALITRIPSDPTVVDRVGAVAEVAAFDGTEPIPRDILLDMVVGVDGVLAMLTDRIDVDVLDAAPDLRVVSNMAVGVDNIDLGACAERGIAVGHTPDVLTETTADTAWMLMLAASRRLREGTETVASGQWGPWNPTELLAHDVSRTALGIVGMGRIGAAIARRAIGFDMQVRFASRSARPTVESTTGATRVSLDVLLSESDHVVLAVPLTAETKHLIGADELARMKPTANLVNIARGPVVDSGALVEALRTGVIRCAGLDVTDPEPLPPDHPLALLPNCLVIPHMGSSTWRTRNAMANLAAENLIAGLLGEPLPHAIG
ncbi:MAG: D-glycerate dehydrogenase [Acidimicrobiia bacterium]|nr:D-glycerate dehydrogenase [Acidimicrobiia bacterium]